MVGHIYEAIHYNAIAGMALSSIYSTLSSIPHNYHTNNLSVFHELLHTYMNTTEMREAQAKHADSPALSIAKALDGGGKEDGADTGSDGNTHGSSMAMDDHDSNTNNAGSK